MSESFESVLERVNYAKYIDEIQAEARKAVEEIGPGRTPGEVEAIQERLQTLFRKQSAQLAKEVGLAGNQMVVFMTALSVLTTAWVSFALKRGTNDLSKSPEDRLAAIEMFDALGLALGNVIQSAGSYAERYQPPPPAAAHSPSGTTSTKRAQPPP